LILKIAGHNERHLVIHVLASVCDDEQGHGRGHWAPVGAKVQETLPVGVEAGAHSRGDEGEGDDQRDERRLACLFEHAPVGSLGDGDPGLPVRLEVGARCVARSQLRVPCAALTLAVHGLQQLHQVWSVHLNSLDQLSRERILAVEQAAALAHELLHALRGEVACKLLLGCVLDTRPAILGQDNAPHVLLLEHSQGHGWPPHVGHERLVPLRTLAQLHLQVRVAEVLQGHVELKPTH